MISNLKVLKASGTGSIYGFYNLASPTNENYNYNTIFNLNHSGTGSVYGIHANTTTGVRTVSFNIIYNITTFGTTVVGISQFLSTPAIFRNKIYECDRFIHIKTSFIDIINNITSFKIIRNKVNTIKNIIFIDVFANTRKNIY